MMPVLDPFMASVPSTGIQRGRGGFLRSKDGAPYVSDPSGATVATGARKGEVKRIKYGSPSGAGTLIENDVGLTKHKQRNTFLGIGMSEELREACRALVDMDPRSEEFTKAADTIVIEADKLTRSWLAADRGTHGHLLCELHDQGRTLYGPDVIEMGEAVGIDATTQMAVVDAWANLLTMNGLEILAVESSCCDDKWRLAGTLDRIVRLTKPLTFVKPGGELVVVPADTVLILDLKFGKCRLAHPIQIASYAQSVPYDTDLETRGEWPWPIDQQHALIAHGDFGDDTRPVTIELVWVDLVAGREHGGQCVVDAKAWAARDDVFSVSQLDIDVDAMSAAFPVQAASPLSTEKTCKIEGCDRPILVKSRGLCDPHYRRERRYGDPLGGQPTYYGDAQKAFAELVLLETDDCVLWPYGRSGGYGYVLIDGVNRGVHVRACEHHHGPRPDDDREVAHSCGVRACMNYRHLRWATHAENLDDLYVCRKCGHDARSVAQIVEGEGVASTSRPDALGESLVDPAPSTLSSAGAPEPSAPSTVGEEAGAANTGHSPTSTWPLADPTRLALVDARGTLCATPNEGADLDDGGFDELWDRLRTEFDALDPAAKAWRSQLAQRASQRGVSFLAQEAKTERRYSINRGLIALAIVDPDDQILRALLYIVLGDIAWFVGIEPGHLVGSLDYMEAAKFADLCDAYISPSPAA